MGEARSIITGCRDFSNVPLIGTKGCINYNLVLTYRQLGYEMDRPPKVEEVSESVYFARGNDLGMLKRVTSAWKGIHKKDRTTLARRFLLLGFLTWSGLKPGLRSYGYHLQGRLLYMSNLLLF